MEMISVGGVELAYDEAGTGPAVVLSHGAMGDRRMWDHQFADLSADHRVVRYDWRGYGDSGDAEGTFAHHRDLLGLLDALDVERAVLVGNSMGAAHALDVALLAPERVTGLVLLSPGLSGHRWPEEMLVAARELVHAAVPADRLDDYRHRRVERPRPEDVAAMAEAQARFMVAGPRRQPGDVDPRVWNAALEMLRGVFEREWSGPLSTEQELEPPAAGRLSEVRVPTLLVNGLEDVPWLQDLADLITEGIPDVRRVDLPDTGHLPPLERPERVTAEIRAFLDAL